ncbi:sensor histidine kinase [Gordonia insulae]|uniref:Histidine kinase/HSP90-like ATPase domain-containing protein n=1 Tax=Gordonia insulae TaxID=2420509 RepID=A0A3G8JTU9_9ACTN|nr:sensor histidine kinase [Gordonia insulae]AZG48343.1 hypothetical protein D7316_04960 [Gordonia insulae]
MNQPAATTVIDRPAVASSSAHLHQWRQRVIGPPDRSDLARVQRVGARFVGCGLITFTVGLTPLIAGRADLTAWWWPVLSVLLVAGPALILIVATYREQLAHLTALAAMCSLGFLAATALWFVAWTGDVPSDHSGWSVWLVQFPGVPGLVFGMVGRYRLALAHIVTAALLAQTANQVGLTGHLVPEWYLGSLMTMALTCVFLAVAVVTVRTAALLDDTRAAAMQAAAASAASTAVETERARFAALVHDKVIAILLAIDVGRPAPRLATQAALALDELDHRDSENPPASVVGVDEFVQRVRTAVTTTDDEVGREFSIDHTVAGRYPTGVVSEMIDAMCEAIRNSGRHAGADASCLVVGDFRADRVTLAIVDDGRGFDPGQVSPERLGVAVGIRRRMTALAGGGAEVRSEPGRGTAVVLRWVHDVGA